MTPEMIKAVQGTIAAYRNDPVIMEFVTKEARQKVADEIYQKTGQRLTAKGADWLGWTRPNIAARIEDYIHAGLVGCLLASQTQAAA